jgi:hypothetical protein
MEWQDFGLNKWRLVDETGCVVGRVECTYDGEYLAFAGKRHGPAIGTYVTEKQAKAGVEGALQG